MIDVPDVPDVMIKLSGLEIYFDNLIQHNRSFAFPPSKKSARVPESFQKGLHPVNLVHEDLGKLSLGRADTSSADTN